MACSVGASAGPIQWNFSGVTFIDGATLTGSFTYDADANVFSNVDVTISGSTTPVFNVTMLFDDPINAAPTFFLASSALPATVDVTPSIFVTLPTAMTDAGGTIPIRDAPLSYAGICATTTCGTYTLSSEYITAGSITTISAVPEPGSWAMLGVGLMGLAAPKLRQRGRRLRLWPPFLMKSPNSLRQAAGGLSRSFV
jgi:hypothetical protein